VSVETSIPRVLVVNGEPFTDATATGITLCNLFSGFPRENLALLFTAQLPVRTDICSVAYKLSATNVVAGGAGPSSAAAITNTASPKSFKYQARAAVRKAIAPILDCTAYKVAPALLEKLRSFEPAIVYTLGGGMRHLQLAMRIAADLKRPLALHFMDDWPGTLYRSPQHFLFRRRLDALLREAMRTAKARLVISVAMADEFQSRYGGRFIPFMNCVSRSDVKAPQVEIVLPERQTICYFGGLHLGRWECVRDIARVISERKLENEFQIHLYCRESDVLAYGPALKKFPSIRFRPAVPPDQVARIMQAANALLHVESFIPAHRAYTRLSISTKIPEYLAASRPIIAYGPAEVASIRYLEENRCALVITGSDPNAIAAALAKLKDPSALKEQSNNAFEMVVAHHVSETERERFRSVLQEASIS
jgi:hypothetical protein